MKDIETWLKNRYPEQLVHANSAFISSIIHDYCTTVAKNNSVSPHISVSLPDPALRLAGKMAMAAETVINSKITTVSVAIAMLEDALHEYNNEILFRQ